MKLFRPTVVLQSLYRRQLCRKMSSFGGPENNHLQRTAENTRNEVLSTATVVNIKDESTTVKSLSLKVHNKHLSFKAGQWVDMFIPGVDIVGGYSMCCSPIKLEQTQLLDLAVKYSKHPPAHWIHMQCKEGSEVAIRVGGDFYYDHTTQGSPDLLLIAGGVGINPLYSIINHVTDLKCKGSHSEQASQRVVLLYSARTEEELLFKNHLNTIQEKDKQLRCKFHVTRNSQDNISSLNTNRRINAEDFNECFDWLRKDHVIAYLCGPSPMLTDIEKLLIERGIPKGKILYEKWW